MAMVPATMATLMRDGIGQVLPVTTELTGWATGIITHITTAALVSHTSGTVTGTAPPSGGPLISGTATGGIISGMSGATMAGLVVSSGGAPFLTAQISTICGEIVTHIQTLGLVNFASGGITGTCTNTVLNPGILSGGTGSGGLVSGLSGSVLAAAIVSADPVSFPSVSSQLDGFCSGIVDHITAAAIVTYAPGLVTGICSVGGGPLISGAASGGLIA